MKCRAGALLVVATLIASTGAWSQGWSGDARFLLATKGLSKNDWSPTEQQTEIGVLTDWRGPDWPVDLAVDFLAAGRNADISSGGFTRQKANTSELDLGVRKIWRPDARLRPYAGGGLALASARLEKTGPAGDISDDDSGTGIWLNGGVFWTLSGSFDLGFDARLSGADVRLFGVKRSAGGAHLGLTAGYHWGG
jgi:hypothetical protein